MASVSPFTGKRKRDPNEPCPDSSPSNVDIPSQETSISTTTAVQPNWLSLSSDLLSSSFSYHSARDVALVLRRVCHSWGAVSRRFSSGANDDKALLTWRGQPIHTPSLHHLHSLALWMLHDHNTETLLPGLQRLTTLQVSWIASKLNSPLPPYRWSFDSLQHLHIDPVFGYNRRSWSLDALVSGMPQLRTLLLKRVPLVDAPRIERAWTALESIWLKYVDLHLDTSAHPVHCPALERFTTLFSNLNLLPYFASSSPCLTKLHTDTMPDLDTIRPWLSSLTELHLVEPECLLAYPPGVQTLTLTGLFQLCPVSFQYIRTLCIQTELDWGHRCEGHLDHLEALPSLVYLTVCHAGYVNDSPLPSGLVEAFPAPFQGLSHSRTLLELTIEHGRTNVHPEGRHNSRYTRLRSCTCFLVNRMVYS